MEERYPDDPDQVLPVPFVLDITPAVLAVVVRLAVLTLPGAPAAPVIADPPAPLAVPAADAERLRVVVRISWVNHDAWDWSHHTDAARQQERSGGDR